MRAVPTALAYCEYSYKSIKEGLKRVIFNESSAQNELGQHWEVLAEAVQLTMRKLSHFVQRYTCFRRGCTDGYNILKKACRNGSKMTKVDYLQLLDANILYFHPDDFALLRDLSPFSYIGISASQAKTLT